MNIIIIYDSVFGNTKEVAQGIKLALEKEDNEVSLYHVKDINQSQLIVADLIVIGSPTRGFKPTKDVVAFIKSMDKTLLRKSKFGVFDTRMDIETVDNKILTFMAKRFGYANDTMTKLIKKQGGEILGQARGFVVEESEGPLRKDELTKIEAFTSNFK